MSRATRARTQGFHPSRAKGQCFLRDERYVERIVQAIAPRAGETILEIGAGQGQLTLPLVRAGARVVAIESDRRLAEELRGSLSSVEGVELLEADALRVDFRDLAHAHGPGKLRVVGNLPYSAAAPILLRLLAARESFRELVLMFQSEVAERLMAKPGTKAYGFLTVVAQRAAKVSVLFRIPPDAFRPRPRVVSALLRFEIRDIEPENAVDEKLFRSLVRGLLAHRRKTIGNNIKHLEPSGLSREATLGALETLGIDPARRAETLGVEEFAELSRICAGLR
ncbi:MAG TPA: 16S rRNA (adenine(1518)-N(6)/adenine(1519)-N(6))-dimethyltransferase RsmA [Vicinamibacteria bacterium]|nr:16S rRNA (adenine(1518)-N(6)/adenine(1519)-N(6))-dimethyltransferase RsmA [Vicinamibacteria bacterium]